MSLGNIALVVTLITALLHRGLSQTDTAGARTSVCWLEGQSQDSQLTQQHVRFFWYNLPDELGEKLRSICGNRHGLSDAHIMDAWPIGFHRKRDTNLNSRAMQECTFGKLYATNQYAAGAMWRQQMMASPLRVDDVNDADVVFVDMVDDICFSADSKLYNKTASLARQALSYVLKHLSRTGKPHIVPLSRYEVNYWEEGGILRAAGAEKLTWISHEITDWAGRGINSLDRAPGGNKRNVSYYNVVPTPYPSTLHMYTHDRYFMHLRSMLQQEGTRRSAKELPDPNTPKDQWPCYLAKKEVLAAGSYAARLPSRYEVKKQCLAAGPEKCQHLEFTFRDTVHKLQDMHDLYSRSWFCLMPPGDTHTRRSFVDCILEDSIPVVFNDWTLESAPFADIVNPKDYVVSLSDLEPDLWQLGLPACYNNTHCSLVVHERIRKRGVPDLDKNFKIKDEARDILSTLEKRYPLEVRMRMVTNIFKIKHLYQMMLNPVHELVRFDQLNEVHCMDDNFTATMKAVLRNLCRRGQLPESRCKGQ